MIFRSLIFVFSFFVGALCLNDTIHIGNQIRGSKIKISKKEPNLFDMKVESDIDIPSIKQNEYVETDIDELYNNENNNYIDYDEEADDLDTDPLRVYDKKS